jgi:nucleoside-diphosphate-sugar epimerase
LPQGVELEQVRADATDEAALSSVLAGAAGVVNCVTGDEAAIVANATALRAAVGRCPAGPRMVYLSSMAVYGQSEGLLSETAGLDTGLTGYGGAKMAAERIVRSYPGCVILRPGIVFGPHSNWWSLQIARLLCQRRLGDLGSNGQGSCNLLYVEDMARAVVEALRRPEVAGATFNLGMSEPPTWNEYFTRYARALGLTQTPQISAARLTMELRVLGPAIKALERVGAPFSLQPPPPIRPWLIQLTRHRGRLDVRAAEVGLGMRWTPVEQALDATAAWFRHLFPLGIG